jgi:predicted nucleic acid-binding protein
MYFFDTSAIAKRYITESGTAYIRHLVIQTPRQALILSELSLIEISSIFSRLHREGKLSSADWRAIQSDFLWHGRTAYSFLTLNRPVINRARQLVATYPLKSLDALQLATALYARQVLGLPQLIFLSGDTKLLKVAQAEGFTAINPSTQA